MMYELYLQVIDQNDEEDKLNSIIENAANCEFITNKQYEELYNKAIQKLQMQMLLQRQTTS